MAEESFQDKTEKATPKRRQEARKKGEVGKSRELPSIAVLSAGVVYLYFSTERMTSSLGRTIERTFQSIPALKFSDMKMVEMVRQSLGDFLWLLLPMMLVLFVVALLANVLQTGLVWSVEPLAPKASKIDPIKGLGRIFAKRTLVELGKSIFKIIIVGWAAFSTLRDEISRLLPLLYQEKIQIISLLGEASFKVIVRCCWIIAILAILDYLYQRWEFEQKLKMTKQEVKDEFKQTEGDPMVKGKIRAAQREMARRRMMEEVPKADVVITNPTHLSIALKYDVETMSSPMIVAKGANRIAFRIREVAAENGVPLVENKPLAQNLYKLELGDKIPSEFYQAVAEILAYVYGLKKRIKRT